MKEYYGIRELAKEYDLPIRFLKGLDKTGRLTFEGILFKKMPKWKWNQYLKDVPDLDFRRESLWDRYKR